jgi:hypothetical protein
MDFLKDVQWGNVFTAITLITTLVLAFRDASRTRAENAAKEAEANSSDGNAAKALSDAAKTQINTYNQEIIVPMRMRLTEMETTIIANMHRIQEVEVRHAELQVKYDNLFREYEKYKVEMVIQVNQLRKTINEKDVEIANLQTQIDRLIKGSKPE